MYVAGITKVPPKKSPSQTACWLIAPSEAANEVEPTERTAVASIGGGGGLLNRFSAVPRPSTCGAVDTSLHAVTARAAARTNTERFTDTPFVSHVWPASGCVRTGS